VIRVLVADDHAVVRRGVADIVNEAPGMTVAGEASTGRQVLQALAQQDYDVLVLDMEMPEGDGLEVLAQMQARRPAPAVLILSIYPEKQFARRALQAGAAGYLTKQSIPDELVAAIRKIARGGRYITQSLAEVLADQVAAAHQALSDREFQVLRLLAAGRTRQQIAAELGLEAKTISTYRQRILHKLGLHSTAEIVRYAVEHNLVD
jgi:two-component system invasion response regulator UvrY